jgi:hypothetical protein
MGGSIFLINLYPFVIRNTKTTPIIYSFSAKTSFSICRTILWESESQVLGIHQVDGVARLKGKYIFIKFKKFTCICNRFDVATNLNILAFCLLHKRFDQRGFTYPHFTCHYDYLFLAFTLWLHTYF